jgi:hypothetical protein
VTPNGCKLRWDRTPPQELGESFFAARAVVKMNPDVDRVLALAFGAAKVNFVWRHEPSCIITIINCKPINVKFAGNSIADVWATRSKLSQSLSCARSLRRSFRRAWAGTPASLDKPHRGLATEALLWRAAPPYAACITALFARNVIPVGVVVRYNSSQCQSWGASG